MAQLNKDLSKFTELKMTLTDSEEEEERKKAAALPQEETEKQKKKRERKDKAKAKATENEDADPFMIDSKFNIIDDSIRKDLSKIARKREYDATKQEGTTWKYQQAVKEDVHYNNTEDAISSLRTKITEMRREADLNEFDKGLEEVYKA